MTQKRFNRIRLAVLVSITLIFSAFTASLGVASFGGLEMTQSKVIQDITKIVRGF